MRYLYLLTSRPKVIKEMEERCEEVEKSIALNNDIVSKQVEEMVRNSVTDSF